MSNVEFDEMQYIQTKNTPKRNGFLVRLMIKTGLFKTKQQALAGLFVVAIIFFVFTGFILLKQIQPDDRTVYLEDIPASDRAKIPLEILESLPSRR